MAKKKSPPKAFRTRTSTRQTSDKATRTLVNLVIQRLGEDEIEMLLEDAHNEARGDSGYQLRELLSRRPPSEILGVLSEPRLLRVARERNVAAKSKRAAISAILKSVGFVPDEIEPRGILAIENAMLERLTRLNAIDLRGAVVQTGVELEWIATSLSEALVDLLGSRSQQDCSTTRSLGTLLHMCSKLVDSISHEGSHAWLRELCQEQRQALQAPSCLAQHRNAFSHYKVEFENLSSEERHERARELLNCAVGWVRTLREKGIFPRVGRVVRRELKEDAGFLHVETWVINEKGDEVLLWTDEQVAVGETVWFWTEGNPDLLDPIFTSSVSRPPQ